MRKEKGVLTVVLSLFMVIIISFSLILTDYARVYSAIEKAELLSDNAVDVGLNYFDEDLQSEYHILGLKDQSLIRTAVKSSIQDSLVQKGSKLGISNLKLLSVDVSFSKNISDNDALKAAIIRAHKKEAVITTLVEYLDKLDVIKNVGKYSFVIDEYTEIIKSVYRIRRTYDRCKQLYSDVETFYNAISGVDYKSVVNEIIDLKSQLVNLKDEDGEKDAMLLDSMVSEQAKICLSIKKLQKKITSLKDFQTSLAEFSSNLAVLSNDFIKVNAEIQNGISKIKGYKLSHVEKVLNVIDTTLEKTRKASDSVLVIINDTNLKMEKLNKSLSAIGESLSKEDRLSDRIVIDNISDFKSVEGLTKLFAGGVLSPELDLKSLAKTMYKLITGKCFSDRISRGSIPGDMYSHLLGLSSGEMTDYDSLSATAASDFKLGALDAYGNVLASSDKSLSFSKNLLNKYILADYVTSIFSYDDSKKFSGKGKEILYGGEVEYILSGRADSRNNILYTDLKIFAIRLVLNSISLMAYKADTINELAASFSSWTGFVSYPVVYLLIVSSWSAVESYIDINSLHDSNEVPILKKGDDICFSYNVNSLKSLMSSDEIRGVYKTIDASNILSFDYRDYLVFLLLIEDETDTLNRIRDLYYMNSSILPDDYSTVVTVNLKYRIDKYLPNAYKELNVVNAGGNYVYEVAITRGY